MHSTHTYYNYDILSNNPMLGSSIGFFVLMLNVLASTDILKEYDEYCSGVNISKNSTISSESIVQSLMREKTSNQLYQYLQTGDDASMKSYLLSMIPYVASISAVFALMLLSCIFLCCCNFCGCCCGKCKTIPKAEKCPTQKLILNIFIVSTGIVVAIACFTCAAFSPSVQQSIQTVKCEYFLFTKELETYMLKIVVLLNWRVAISHGWAWMRR